jgi:enoyl-CoA hydratase/carnithine racemase
VVLTGAGRGFCSGIDVRDFGPSIPDATDPATDRLRFQEMMAGLPAAIRALPQPVIAAVNGPAVGAGLALCLASDVRICGASASFGNGAILLGLSGAEMGMSYYLPRIVGLSVAADWMLTGRTVPADEAYRCRLVSELVEDDRLLDRALELAAQIAAHSPLGVQMTKRALQVNTDAPDLSAALEVENRNQVITHATDEAAAARQRWSGGAKG